MLQAPSRSNTCRTISLIDWELLKAYNTPYSRNDCSIVKEYRIGQSAAKGRSINLPIKVQRLVERRRVQVDSKWEKSFTSVYFSGILSLLTVKDRNARNRRDMETDKRKY